MCNKNRKPKNSIIFTTLRCETRLQFESKPFNIYINELADMLDHSAAPGFTLFNTEVKYLLYADDLVILLPTKEGLQQNLNILEQYCHNWALAVNKKTTKIMKFPEKKPDVRHTKINSP